MAGSEPGHDQGIGGNAVNAELPDAFPPAALPLTGEGAPALLVTLLAAMGAALSVVSTSIWLAPPVTPPEPVTVVVHEQAPAPPPIVIHEQAPAPPPTIIRVTEPAPPPPCFDPVTLIFARGSAAPPAGTDAGIARLNDWLGRHADARLLVEGHADNLGSEGHNLVLSFARAKSVASILARNGVPAGRVTVRAAGAADAAAKADARDRRVVVGIEGLAACKSAASAVEHP
jgi:outer membrane protein OmpA-like peptidoglycan-associated protein